MLLKLQLSSSTSFILAFDEKFYLPILNEEAPILLKKQINAGAPISSICCKSTAAINC